MAHTQRIWHILEVCDSNLLWDDNSDWGLSLFSSVYGNTGLVPQLVTTVSFHIRSNSIFASLPPIRRYTVPHILTASLDKRFFNDEEVETEVRKCLRQQSKDLHAVGFDALVKRWDKRINVDGGYVEKEMFLPVSNTTCFTFCIHLWSI
jgi:hypothetical protein